VCLERSFPNARSFGKTLSLVLSLTLVRSWPLETEELTVLVKEKSALGNRTVNHQRRIPNGANRFNYHQFSSIDMSFSTEGFFHVCHFG